MNGFFSRLRSRAEALLGLDRLTGTFRTFALLHFGFLIFNNLQTVFINTLSSARNDVALEMSSVSMIIFSFVCFIAVFQAIG